MRTWDLPLPIDPSAREPVFLQIARAIAADVRRGRLKPGEPLPGSRPLSRLLSVHRNTVVAAYRELVAEGWARALPASGTVVSSELPDPKPRAFAAAEPRLALPRRCGFELYPAPPGQAVSPRLKYPMSGGVPDVRLVPAVALARAYRRAVLKKTPRGATALDYGDARGHPRLRAALAAMLSALRGLPLEADDVVVVRGSQMGLDLVARTLLQPGDAVAVEEMGYPPAWEALRRAGGKLLPLRIDAGGLRIDSLRELLARQKLRAVYVTPHHQYPTGAVLSAGRRLELLELARAHRLAVIEDDYDHEFHYEGRPVLPLASADRHGVVVYIGSLSKILAPGLRIGFAAAPRPLLDQLVHLRTVVDRQGDQAVEQAVAELIEDGELQRHARKARAVYRSRRDALCEALRRQLGDRLRFVPPRGGLALWARTACDPEDWAARAAEQGVAIAPGRRFSFAGRRVPFARLGYASLDERELHEAAARLAAAWPID